MVLEALKRKPLPAFRPNTHYPTERIGNARLPLRIDLVSLEDSGWGRP